MANRLKVLQVSTFNQPCGIATYTADLANALQTLGHEVTVLAERASGKLPDQKGEIRSIPYLRYWERHRFQKEVLRAVELIKPDVVHIQHEYALFQDWSQLKAIELQCPVPVIITAHTPDHRPPLCELYKNLQPDAWIFHNPTAKELFTSPSFAIHHGVGTCPEEQFVGQYWLVPGFVSPTKRTVHIIQSWITSGSQFPLKIVGRCRDDNYAAHIQQYCDAYHDIEWKNDFVKSLDEYFAHARGIVLGAPSYTASSASGQVAKALQHGKALLARHTEIYRTAGGAAVYFGKWSELAQLFKTYSKIQLFEQEEIARRLAAQRNWKRIAEQHVAVYKEAYGNRVRHTL